MVIFFTSFFILSLFSVAQDPDLEKIRRRVIFDLMQPDVDYERIETLISTINRDGSWPGINYEDTSRTGFEHSRHLANMVDLSHAYRKSHTRYYEDRKTRKALKRALDFWFENDFICENWWWNQIGTPDRMVSVLLIMDDELTDKEIEQAAPIVGRANLDAWGARPGGDLIKIAGILGKYALFKRDEETLKTVVNTMANEIQYAVDRGTPDDIRGLQTDLSFHHRGDRVNNTLSYGLQFAAIFAEWAAKIGDTKYRFPDQNFRLLVDYYLDGICKMMVHGTFPDLGAKNRSISRTGALHPHGPEVPKNLILAGNYRNEELAKIIQIRNRNAEPDLQHSTFFWQSEYYSHQRPDYFSSVRMYSTRNRSMEEPYNGEGLKNHHLGEGSNFIYTSGIEYFDIFPLFDWQKIPGTTVAQRPSLPPENQIQREGLSDFVGGVTNGRLGAAIFDFKSPYYDLKAKKAWFFFDDEYVCLGAGISSTLADPIVTTINQTWQIGPVTAMQDGKISELEKGPHTLRNTSWVMHKDIAYIFPTERTLSISNEERTGTWFSINRQNDSPKEEVKGNVFTAWIDHGNQVTDATYQYIVVPEIERKGIENYENDLPIQILSNTPEIQAVRNKRLDVTQIIFHNPGKLRITENVHVISAQPCMVMLEDLETDSVSMTLSDPSRKLETLTILINREVKSQEDFEVSWDEIEGYSELTVDLPQGNYAGQSVMVSF